MGVKKIVFSALAVFGKIVFSSSATCPNACGIGKILDELNIFCSPFWLKVALGRTSGTVTANETC